MADDAPKRKPQKARKVIMVIKSRAGDQIDKHDIEVLGATRDGATALELMESNPGATYITVDAVS